MKIAFLVPSLANKGPVKVVFELIEQLKNEHKIEIFYFKDSREVTFDVHVQKIDFLQPIDFNSFDIIHSHGIRPDAYVFFHHKKITTAKTVTTLHNYVKADLRYQYNPLTSFIFSYIWNIVTSQHDQIITLSKHAKDYYLDFWHNKTIDYVYNGIQNTVDIQPLDATVKKKITHLSEHFVLLGAIGLLTQIKGFEQIIKALPGLKKHALIIAGNGKEEENLKALCSDLNVSERVLFLGFEPNIPAVMEMIDIVVAPSRSEGFSLVIQEAARQKKAVICSDIPIFHELFSGDEVVFFPLDDIDMLTNKVKMLTTNSTNLGDNLHKKLLATYTSEHMARNYVKQYHHILDDS